MVPLSPGSRQKRWFKSDIFYWVQMKHTIGSWRTHLSLWFSLAKGSWWGRVGETSFELEKNSSVHRGMDGIHAFVHLEKSKAARTQQEWLEDAGDAHRPARHWKGCSGREETAVLGFLGLVSLVLNCKREIPSENWEVHHPPALWPWCHCGCSLFFSLKGRWGCQSAPNSHRLCLSSARGPFTWHSCLHI